MATSNYYSALATTNERIDDVLVRICEKLQLTETQYQNAKQSYEAICEWLDASDSELQIYSPHLYPQGSVALNTTVKPLRYDEYDVDLVCRLNIDSNSVADPLILLDMIETRLRQHKTYANLLERKNRCIRINYERQFHLDILPACPDQAAGGTCLLIPDCKQRIFSKTNPEGFVNWFKLQSMKRVTNRWQHSFAKDSAAPLPDPQPVSQKQVLQLAVQLFKRWRDIYYVDLSELAPVSIVLTTLSGTHYGGEQSLLEALKMIIDGIIESIPATGRLIVKNPANFAEDLSDRWNDPIIYEAFLHGLRSFAVGLHELKQSVNIVEATKRIKELFGEEITKAVFSDQLREIEPARKAEALSITNVGVLSSTMVAMPVKSNTFYGD